MLCFFAMYNFFMTVMYCSVVISKVTAKSQVRAIDSLEDLLRPEHLQTRIWANKFSFISDHLKSQSIFDQIKDRVDFYEEPLPIKERGLFYNNIFKTVLKNSHVIIDLRMNMIRYLGHSGVMIIGDFHQSRERVSVTLIAWLLRKDLSHAEAINRGLMWLDSFGLGRRNLRKNDGVRSDICMHKFCGGRPQHTDSTSLTYGLDTSTGTDRTGKKRESQPPLNLFHVGLIFRVYGIGIGIAAVVFLIETAWPAILRLK
jgi:hypothetical protein